MAEKINPDLDHLARPIGWFKLDPNNARKHEEPSVDVLMNSLTDFEQNKNVVCLDDGTVIAGNGMVMAAKALGWGRLAAVTFRDRAKAEAYALADNRSAEKSTWDPEPLSAGLRRQLDNGVSLARMGFDDGFLKRTIVEPHLRVRLQLPAVEEKPIPDAVSVAPDSKVGSLYQLGPHRLAVGDSRDAAVVRELMGGGVADLVWTDPPYGVSYVGGFGHQFNPDDRIAMGGLTIAGDDLTPDQLRQLLMDALSAAAANTKDGGVFYVCSPAGPLQQVFGDVLGHLGIWRHTLIWAKGSFVMGRSDYHYRHEPIFYGWKDGSAHYFIDDRTQDSVHEFPRPHGNDKQHPTMKPVELVRKHVHNSSRAGEKVLDAFCGSGTTIIACAEEGRVGYGVEVDPKYADVIRKRWTAWAAARGVDPGSGAL